MTNITALIVALLLTGSPVMSGVCTALCGRGPAPTAHCHESLTESARTAMSGEPTCAAVTPDVPYVKDNVTAPQAVSMAGAPAQPVPGTPGPRTFNVAASTAAPWLAPALVLRL